MPKVVMFKNGDNDLFRFDNQGNLVLESDSSIQTKIIIEDHDLASFYRWIGEQIQKKNNSSVDPY